MTSENLAAEATDGAASAASSSGAWAVWPLMFLVLLDAMGFAMVAPILADVLAGNTGPSLMAKASLDERQFVYGIAVGLYPLLTFVGGPFLGQLSDVVGRRIVLLICLSGLIASYGALSLGLALGQVWLIYLARAVGGFTAASQAVSLAALVDISRPESKSFNLSMGLLASSLGFVIGPALGGFLSDPKILPWFTYQTPLDAIVILGLLNLAMLALYFHESRPARRRLASVDWSAGIKGLYDVFQRPALRSLSFVFFVQQLSWGAYFFLIPLFIIKKFDFTGSGVSLFMSVIGVGFSLSFAFVFPWLVRRYKVSKIAEQGLAITAGLMLLSTITPVEAHEWLLAIPIAIAVAASYGALIDMFTDLASSQSEGQILGVTASLNAMAFGLSSMVGGALENLGMGAPLFAAIFLMGSSWLLLLAHNKNYPAPTPHPPTTT
jgi:MFS family permease